MPMTPALEAAQLRPQAYAHSPTCTHALRLCLANPRPCTAPSAPAVLAPHPQMLAFNAPMPATATPAPLGTGTYSAGPNPLSGLSGTSGLRMSLSQTPCMGSGASLTGESKAETQDQKPEPKTLAAPPPAHPRSPAPP